MISQDAKTILDRIADGRTDLVFDFLKHGDPSAEYRKVYLLLQRCAYYGGCERYPFSA
jgi:hypothetical protein